MNRRSHSNRHGRLASPSHLLLAFGLLPLMLGARECEKVEVGDLMCEHAGETHEVGDRFTAEDGCNTCTCEVGGNVACTERACVPGSCEHGGETYDVGDTFTSDDGCNTCTCDGDGKVACTTRACAPGSCDYAGEKHAAGDTFPSEDGCNTCSCGDDGLVACTERACLDECGGIRGLACPAGYVCMYPASVTCGSADFTGHCVERPTLCGEIYAPVCGCDGQTYDNRCSALVAEVIVASEGECDRGGAICGTRGAEPCGADEFCDYPASAICGAADAPGMCRPRPPACDDIYEPVCGCDGMTYGNACEAAAAGSSVSSRGECPPADGCVYNGERHRVGDSFPADDGCNTCSCGDDGLVACTERACPDFCGGIAGFGCPAGEYCNYPPSASCGAADQTGNCEPMPDACTREYVPVCGCDGTTYSNACSAAAAGVSIASRGACGSTCVYEGMGYAAGDTFKASDGCNDCTCSDGGNVACTARACERTCGGLTGGSCEPGEFCYVPTSGICGAADAQGVCRTRSTACITLYDPVCGCDGQTYGNSCEAAAAGVSIASSGECS